MQKLLSFVVIFAGQLCEHSKGFQPYERAAKKSLSYGVSYAWKVAWKGLL